MIGAIAGDIIGSVYEWNDIKTKNFPLFSDKCCFYGRFYFDHCFGGFHSERAPLT